MPMTETAVIPANAGIQFVGLATLNPETAGRFVSGITRDYRLICGRSVRLRLPMAGFRLNIPQINLDSGPGYRHSGMTGGRCREFSCALRIQGEFNKHD